MIGGHPAADFLNTIDARGFPNALEHLRDYASFLRWVTRAKLMNDTVVGRLRMQAQACPKEAREALLATIAFREAVHELVASRSGPQRPRALSHRVVEEAIASANAAHVATWTRSGLVWRWRESSDLRCPLYVVSLEVADLLEPDNLSRLHVCAGDECDWVFLDASPTQRRRWCHMSACGNRAKVRGFRARRSRTDTE
jgi:predicted RNA-binding Zn ribbon-like protein